MDPVVVVGGGPAGSVTAARLAQRGIRVVLLEKARFPRFHLGESLLPQSLPVLAAIGVLPKIEAEFLPKYGARFHDDVGGRKERFVFESAWRAEPDHAFEVPRDRFDHVLLEHARSLGVDVREGVSVDELVYVDGRAQAVRGRDEAGAAIDLAAAFVIDATGRSTLTARAGEGTTRIDGLEQTALFTQFEGVARPSGKLAGDIDIVLFPSGEPRRANWFWLIPFRDGRTSVGAVVSRAWIRERRAAGGATPTELFAAAVRASPTATELLAGARRLWPEAQATADFSYRVGTLSGPGWVAIGDAAGFIDPLFSTGAHLAMVGGCRAADAVADALERPEAEAERLAAFTTSLRAAAETFILAVTAFYEGPLVELLFAPDKHLALRRSITSLLAGDVFHDALWLRDARTRLRDLLR